MGAFIANLVWISLNSLMAWSWYVGNYDYLNIVTIFYVLILIINIPLCPLLAVISHGGLRLKEDVKKSIKEWSSPSFFSMVGSLIKNITTITLMVLCGYMWLVVFYLLMILWSLFFKEVAKSKL